MSTQSRSLRFADELVRHPYAMPGAYPMFALTHDGQALCSKCCSTEREAIATTTGNDGWGIIALSVNWEGTLPCANCGQVIESAY